MTLRQLLAHPLVRGVAVGACVNGSKWNPKERAHAHAPHTSARDGRLGWICIESPRDLSDSDLLFEELAHLVAKTNGTHDAAFRRAELELRRQYK